MLKSGTFLVGLFALAACSASNENNQELIPSSLASTRASVAQNTLVVTSVNQSSNGATAADITPEFVSMIEGHFAEVAKKQSQIAMKNLGYPGESISYEVGTLMFDEDGEKLAVTVLKPAGRGGPITKIAWWIADGEIRRVGCIDTAGNEIPIRFGACAQKISEVFGYKDWPLDSKLP